MEMSKTSIILADSTMLNSEELLNYFSDSPNNKIVLPDYIAMEAYKGDKFESILMNMETLSKYPQQIMVLHGTRAVTKLKDHSDVLKWKFINRDHTKSFDEYCRQLYLAQKGDVRIQQVILSHAAAANDIMSAILKDAGDLSLSFKYVEETLFDESEKLIFRKFMPFTQAMMHKIYYLAEKLGNEVYFQHPDHKRIPRPQGQSKRPLVRGCGGKKWWPWSESNQRHDDFQSSALPTELHGHVAVTGVIRFGGRIVQPLIHRGWNPRNP